MTPGDFDPTRERGSVVLFLLGLGVALLLLGGIALDLWRLVGERRELASLADAAALAATSGIDIGAFRQSGVLQLEPGSVDLLIEGVLLEQSDDFVSELRRPVVEYDLDGCDVAVRLEKTFDFSLLALGEADDITLTATGCALIHHR